VIENSVPPQPEKLVVLPEIKDSFTVIRDPNVILKEAMKAATALKKVIDAKPHKIILNGEIYLENEDWLTIARFYGVTSRIRSTSYVKFGDDDYASHGFEATAEAYLVQTDQVISMAESMCLSDETNWKNKPLFQLRSMAQTRASSRVLRQVLGWVVVLAGYKPTPAEEMINGAGTLPLGLCADCGEDIRVESEIYDSKKKFGKKLCRICFKLAIAKENAGANRNLEPELRRSVQQAQARKPVNAKAEVDLETDLESRAGD
jgi:hypothetical protein